MRSSGMPVLKPLVPVAGTSLIERNFQQLIKFGFNEVFVSLREADTGLLNFTEDRLQPLARYFDISLDCIIEREPLGNLGCIREIPSGAPTLVVFADNLTNLDLRKLFEHHVETSPALTLATHTEAFSMPFGSVSVEGEQISAYHEKPNIEFTVSSGICVLGDKTYENCPDQKTFGMSDLVSTLCDRGMRVGNFPHKSLWIDVNDKESVLAAESLVANHPEAFEHWNVREPNKHLKQKVMQAISNKSNTKLTRVDMFDGTHTILVEVHLERGKPQALKTVKASVYGKLSETT